MKSHTFGFVFSLSLALAPGCSSDEFAGVPSGSSDAGDGGDTTAKPTAQRRDAGRSGNQDNDGATRRDGGGQQRDASDNAHDSSDSGLSGLDGSVVTDAGDFSELDAARPNAAPVPGNEGVLSVTDQTFKGVTLSWATAADDRTPAAELGYRIYRSREGHIRDLASLEMRGTSVTEWTAGIESANVPLTLEPGVDNYLNVVVWDADGARALYAGVQLHFEESESCVQDADCFSGECTVSYRDLDQDGFGAAAEKSGRCDGSTPAGHVSNDDDCCDDGGNLELAASMNPGQTEFFYEAANICGIAWDYDCSGTIQITPESHNGGCSSSCVVLSVKHTEKDCGTAPSFSGCTMGGGNCVGFGGPGTPIECR